MYVFFRYAENLFDLAHHHIDERKVLMCLFINDMTENIGIGALCHDGILCFHGKNTKRTPSALL